jgi:hypothetical protein
LKKEQSGEGAKNNLLNFLDYLLVATGTNKVLIIKYFNVKKLVLSETSSIFENMKGPKKKLDFSWRFHILFYF